MNSVVMVVIASGLLAAPVQAADWNDVRPGAFIGARLTVGGRMGSRPSASLTIAPTQTRVSNDGMPNMRIGEGVAFNLTSGAKPTVTLAGVRADMLLGLRQGGNAETDGKVGVSTGGWVAIGVGTAALVGAALFYNAATSCADHDDEC